MKCVLILLGCFSIMNTFEELKDHIEKTKDFNRACEQDRMPWLKRIPYTLRDYADRRIKTDLTRFNFCPSCGEKIGWKILKTV